MRTRSSPDVRVHDAGRCGAGSSPLTWLAITLSLLLMLGLIGYVVDLRGLVAVLAAVFGVAIGARAADTPQHPRRPARRRPRLRAPARH